MTGTGCGCGFIPTRLLILDWVGGRGKLTTFRPFTPREQKDANASGVLLEPLGLIVVDQGDNAEKLNGLSQTILV